MEVDFINIIHILYLLQYELFLIETITNEFKQLLFFKSFNKRLK